MKKILLVDDDAFFRTMFLGFLPWHELGFSLIQAENGREAIEILHKHSDIVLIFTDMNMPVMDGVALVDYLSKHYSYIRCVTLSAFDSFEYVKPSFKSGVEDYLLKHTLTREQLITLIDKSPEGGRVLPSQSAERDDLRARFLFDLVSGKYQSSIDVEELLSSLMLPSLADNLLLAVLMSKASGGVITFGCNADATGARLRTALSMLQNLVDRIGSGVVFQGPEDHLIYVIITAPGFENSQFAQQTASVVAVQAENIILRYFNYETRLYFAALSRDVASLPNAYAQIMNEAGHPTILPVTRDYGCIPLPDASEIKQALSFGTDWHVRQLVSASFIRGRQQHADCLRFRQLVDRCAKLWDEVNQGLSENDVLPVLTREQLSNEPSNAVQEELIVSAFLKLLAPVSSAARKVFNPIVYRALCQIYRDYGDKNLSLASIAGAVRTNPAYLSRLFKDQVGQNISDYTAARRMACACGFLTDGTHSIREVSSLCGYENYNYFFKVFKNQLGMTPNEYRMYALSQLEESEVLA